MLEKILNELSADHLDCDYWDVRLEEVSKSELIYRNKKIEGAGLRPSLGAFLRVYKNGRWSYTASTELKNLRTSLEQMCAELEQLPAREKKPYPGPPAYNEKLLRFSEHRADRISLAEKRAALESYLPIYDRFALVKESKILFRDQYKLKGFKASTGSQYLYDYNEFGAKLMFTLREGENIFEDSLPLFSTQLSELMGKQEELARQIEESARFLKAKDITAGNYSVVMSSPVVGVFAHESFGHKSEADFMLGDDNAREQWRLGSTVGSEVLSIVDTGNAIGTSGYCPFDDEGWPNQKTYLIKNGKLSGRLHSQVTAQEFDEAPTGNGRALNFEFEPIVRMTSTYVEAGALTFEELISQVDFGVYVPQMKHGSGLSTFTIAPTRAYYIRHGKIAEPVKVSVISGSVFETLKNVKAVSKEFSLDSSAIGGCGKGEQGPLPVSFGGPYVLVENMVVS